MRRSWNNNYYRILLLPKLFMLLEIFLSIIFVMVYIKKKIKKKKNSFSVSSLPRHQPSPHSLTLVLPSPYIYTLPIDSQPPVMSYSSMYFSHWSSSRDRVFETISFFRITQFHFFPTLVLMIYTKWKGYLYIGKGFIRLSRSAPRCEKKTSLHYVNSNDLWAWCPADRQWFDVIDRSCDDDDNDDDTTVSNHRFEN